MMGELHSLGIGKGVTYRPDVRTLEIFERAIAEAHAYMVEGWRHAGFEWWPRRTWRYPVGEDVIKSGGEFIADERVLVDERAFNFFGAFGMSRHPQPNLHVMTFEDSRGELLGGSNTYRLRVPADVPTKQFWSVVAYDTETAAFIREAPARRTRLEQCQARAQSRRIDRLLLRAEPPRGTRSTGSTTAGRRSSSCFATTCRRRRSSSERRPGRSTTSSGSRSQSSVAATATAVRSSMTRWEIVRRSIPRMRAARLLFPFDSDRTLRT